MSSVTVAEQTAENWDLHVVRWRLQAYREAAVRLLEGQSPRRVAPVYLHQTLGMPQEDARAVGERVSAELALRTWLAL